MRFSHMSNDFQDDLLNFLLPVNKKCATMGPVPLHLQICVQYLLSPVYSSRRMTSDIIAMQTPHPLCFVLSVACLILDRWCHFEEWFLEIAHFVEVSTSNFPITGTWNIVQPLLYLLTSFERKSAPSPELGLPERLTGVFTKEMPICLVFVYIG